MHDADHFPDPTQSGPGRRRRRSPRNDKDIEANWRARAHAMHARPSRGIALGEGVALAAYIAWVVLMWVWMGQHG